MATHQLPLENFLCEIAFVLNLAKAGQPSLSNKNKEIPSRNDSDSPCDMNPGHSTQRNAHAFTCSLESTHLPCGSSSKTHHVSQSPWAPPHQKHTTRVESHHPPVARAAIQSVGAALNQETGT